MKTAVFAVLSVLSLASPFGPYSAFAHDLSRSPSCNSALRENDVKIERVHVDSDYALYQEKYAEFTAKGEEMQRHLNVANELLKKAGATSDPDYADSLVQYSRDEIEKAAELNGETDSLQIELNELNRHVLEGFRHLGLLKNCLAALKRK